MKTKLSLNLTDLTITCNGKVSQYKNKHAFNTAWLHRRILTERLDYIGYTRRFQSVNNSK